MIYSIDELCIQPDIEHLAPVDRPGHKPENEYQQEWQQNGCVILKDFLPNDLIQSYVDAHPGGRGFSGDTSYMHVPAMRDLFTYPPLLDVAKGITGDDMGVHLSLNSWYSTSRNFHADSYLSDEKVGTRYMGVWYALEDIHKDSGPFQYVKGSHTWGFWSRDLVMDQLSEEERLQPWWPKNC